MKYLPLLGIAVILAGFLLKLRVTVVVLAAGILTGALARMPPVGTADVPGIVDTLGKGFADTRIVTLFVLALPAIGLSERYGLQEQARRFILRIRAATVGRLQLVYQLFRVLVVGLGIRLGSGHVTFSRPLVVPMALGTAGIDEDAEHDEAAAERIKAASGASENYGNFFAQNLFPGAAGIAIVVSGVKSAGYEIEPGRVAIAMIPVAVASVVLGAIQFGLLDRWLRNRRERAAERPAEECAEEAR
jgi:uncharacterized membrane protein